MMNKGNVQSDKRYSIPFGISLYDNQTDNIDESESKVSNTIEVKFLLNDNGNPYKIGDGSSGTVYRGRIVNGGPVAIKVLYDNESVWPRQLSKLNNEELDMLITSLAQDYDLIESQITLLRKTITQYKNSGYILLEKIKNLTSEDDNLAKLDHGQFLNKLIQRANSSAVEHFQRERSITKDLLEKIREWVGPQNTINATEGIVEVIGGTSSFLDYIKDGGNLNEIGRYFAQQAIKVSNYVLVMELYDCSLKDLLERSNLTIRSESGYELLKKMPHAMRSREAVLILEKAANGLRKLHHAGGPSGHFLHRDIRPSNIFIRNTYIPFLHEEDNQDKGSGFDVALGAPGNLPTTAPSSRYESTSFNSILAKPMEHEYSPGTQHYRSPEQKYYRDVATVQVVHLTPREINERFEDHSFSESVLKSNDSLSEIEKSDNSASIVEADIPHEDNAQVVLIVDDPKFKNTLLGTGDIVMFSKDAKQNQYLIRECISSRNHSGQNSKYRYVFILFELGAGSHIKPDIKTQVEFYKKQSFRTDLFSIGAVLFDMVTAGRSAEQFYESIHKYEGCTVQSIVARYDALTRNSEMAIENQDFAEIFRPFRHHQDGSYPDTEIIKFLLQCMLYTSHDTFYGQHKERPWVACTALYNKLQVLRKYYNNGSSLTDSQSMLIHGYTFSQPSAKTVFQLSHKIDMLQGLSEWPGVDRSNDALVCANRLMYGAYYFWRLVAHVRKSGAIANLSSGNRPQGPPEHLNRQLTTDIDPLQNRDPRTLRDMSPTSILIELPNEIGPVQIEFGGIHIEPYELNSQNGLALLTRSSVNPFIANEIASMYRNVKLFVKNEKISDLSDKCECKYWFQDAAIGGSPVLKGGWIAFQDQLWRVVEESNENLLKLNLLRPKLEGSWVDSLSAQGNRYVTATYIANIDPIKYYLEMLGLFLQHLLFVYSPITSTARDRFDIRTLLRIFEIRSSLAIEPIENSCWDPDSHLEGIYERYIDMLLRLTLHEAKGSYYSQIDVSLEEKLNDENPVETKNMVDVFSYSIQSNAAKIYQDVLSLLDYQFSDFEDYPSRPIEMSNLPKQFRIMFDELKVNPIDIEIKIKRSGLITYM